MPGIVAPECFGRQGLSAVHQPPEKTTNKHAESQTTNKLSGGS